MLYSKLALLAIVAFTACAQNAVLHPPPLPVVVNYPQPYIENFPASMFTAPASPVVLTHPPDTGTVVRMILKSATGLFLDQTSTVKTDQPLTLTIDQSDITVGAVVTFEYYSSK